MFESITNHRKLKTERSLLGLIILIGAIPPNVRETLTEDNFIGPQNIWLYRAMCSLSDAGGQIDPLSLRDMVVHDEIERCELAPPEATSVQFISALTYGLPCLADMDSLVADIMPPC